MLLDAGARLGSADGKGGTPLLKAVFGAHADALRLLVDRGADVNAVATAARAGRGTG